MKPVLKKQPNVDLEKELEKWRHDHFKGKRDGDYDGEYLDRESQLDLVRHFYEQAEKDLSFTHIEPTDDEKMAAVHYMEDCQEVDDFVRRGIDEIAERYFAAGAKWEKNKEK